MSFLKKIDNIVGRALDFIPIVLTIFLLVVLSVNIFFRWFPIYNLTWYNEIVELAFAWMIFIGAASLWRKREHTNVDLLLRQLSGKKAKLYLEIFIELLSFVFVFVFLKYSIELMQRARAVSPILQIPKQYFYLSMPISGVIMLIYSIKNLIGDMLRIKGD